MKLYLKPVSTESYAMYSVDDTGVRTFLGVFAFNELYQTEANGVVVPHEQ